MLSAVQIKPDVYWVGALDWNAREFHGYTTEAGITYNAYLILDEKVTLIDTAKITFKDELLQRISSVIDPSKIDVLIANHVEMDHSGSTSVIHELAPGAQIYCSAPQGVKNMTAHFGDLGYNGVKTGDTLCIGKRTLTFVQTPMVHWPDNMVTYDAYDKILFSNDAFGQHFASSARFDDENDMCEVMHQARKYYANIVQPYRTQAAAAVKAVRGLGADALDLICPAHGVIWRGHVEDILAAYEGFVSGEVRERGGERRPALGVLDPAEDALDGVGEVGEHALQRGRLPGHHAAEVAVHARLQRGYGRPGVHRPLRDPVLRARDVGAEGLGEVLPRGDADLGELKHLLGHDLALGLHLAEGARHRVDALLTGPEACGGVAHARE